MSLPWAHIDKHAGGEHAAHAYAGDLSVSEQETPAKGRLAFGVRSLSKADALVFACTKTPITTRLRHRSQTSSSSDATAHPFLISRSKDDIQDLFDGLTLQDPHT